MGCRALHFLCCWANQLFEQIVKLWMTRDVMKTFTKVRKIFSHTHIVLFCKHDLNKSCFCVHIDIWNQITILCFETLSPQALCYLEYRFHGAVLNLDVILSCRKVSRGINIWGLVSVILFYLLILLIGVYAAWKNKSVKTRKSEDIMLAKRNIGMALGLFTMTGTA